MHFHTYIYTCNNIQTWDTNKYMCTCINRTNTTWLLDSSSEDTDTNDTEQRHQTLWLSESSIVFISIKSMHKQWWWHQYKRTSPLASFFRYSFGIETLFRSVSIYRLIVFAQKRKILIKFIYVLILYTWIRIYLISNNLVPIWHLWLSHHVFFVWALRTIPSVLGTLGMRVCYQILVPGSWVITVLHRYTRSQWHCDTPMKHRQIQRMPIVSIAVCLV